METVVLADDRCLAHDPGLGHPESSARLLPTYRALWEHPVPNTRELAAREARHPELELVHDAAHVARVAATAGRPRERLDADTATSEHSYEAAKIAAGAAMQAAEAVVSGQAHGAFAIVRPPGHHATPHEAMGFCLFNNVAVAAAHAIAELGCRRVLVLDPDVHHGNGTQDAFYRRDDVLYVSSHRFPFYPGTGWFDEVGLGPGQGYNVNLPLPPAMGDGDFYFLYREVVGRIVDEYQPDLILVSAGFDTWHEDPLGGMRMTSVGQAALFGLFHEWAERHCPGRIAAALEGGYDPAGVLSGVRAGLEAMSSGRPHVPIDEPPSPTARTLAEKAKRTLSPYWKSLRDVT